MRQASDRGRLGEARAALQQLENFAQILEVKDAEQPILHPQVRDAMMEWLFETRAVDELAKVGLKPRRTCLLYGPPGTGKTTLAHHVAARMGVPLVAVQTEDLIDKYVGSTGRNIGQLFDLLAKVSRDCVVLLDEIDSIASNRKYETGADDERSHSLNVLLRRIEVFDGVAIGATNRREAIDPAMWRRFGLQIEVALPGPEERFAILRRYSAPYDWSDEDIDILVEQTQGSSPSLLRQLMEGIKRSMVVNQMLGRGVPDAETMFGRVISAIEPPPQMDRPFLWAQREKALKELRRISWPPQAAAAPPITPLPKRSDGGQRKDERAGKDANPGGSA